MNQNPPWPGWRIGVLIAWAIVFAAAQAEEDRAPREDAPLSVEAILTHDDALAEAHDVQLLGDLAFVPGKGGSLAIVDVADPARPELLWFRRDPEALRDAETVLLFEGGLFLGTNDFHSIDISNPRSPQFQGEVSDPPRIHRINGMVRRGPYIFAANKDGWIDVFDVSDPAAPRLAEAFETRQAHDVAYPHDVDLLDQYLVVADPQGFGAGGKNGKLAVFRVFNEKGDLLPGERWRLSGVVSSRELIGANRVQVSGRYAYVAGSCRPEVSQGRPSAGGVVIDLASPAQPRQAAAVRFPDLRGPNGLAVAGKMWFLAGGQTVEAYDIRNPSAPRKMATFRSAEAFPTADDNAHDLVYQDGYLYVSGQGDNRLVILRVNDPEIVRLAVATVDADTGS